MYKRQVTIVGVVMVVLGAGTDRAASLTGNLWAIGALICWAGYFIGSKSARRHIDNNAYLCLLYTSRCV